jgi:hypothetical protein
MQMACMNVSPVDNAIASTPAPSISGLLTRKSKKTDPVVHEHEIKQK